MKRVLALILAVAMLLLASCGTDNTPTVTDGSSVAAANALQHEAVKAPFKKVMSPIVHNNKLIMSVSTQDRAETDCRYLISYDKGSGDYKTIFESTYEFGDITDIVSSGEWLIWRDHEIYNSGSGIYCMNYATMKITKIAVTDENSSIDDLSASDGVVFWYECSGIGSKKQADFIKAYDCKTKELKTISESEGGSWVSAGDGKAVFMLAKSGKTSLGVYDIASGNIREIALGEGNYRWPSCAGGSAVCVYTDDPTHGSSSQKTLLIDLSTGKITDAGLMPGQATMFGDYAFACSATAVWFYKRSGDSFKPIDGLVDKNAVAAYYGGDNTVISVAKNAGFGSEEAVNETELHIFDFNKLNAA